MSDKFLRYRCAQFFAVATVVGVVFGSSATAQVNQRSSLLMRDIAKVTLDASGKSQITYNPAICRRLGPELCEYFHAHEMGHVNLRHLERGVPPQRAEAEADRYAASHASPAAVAAARRFFSNGNGASSVHGSGQQRAARLSQPLTTTQVSQRRQAPRETQTTKTRMVEGSAAAPLKYSGGSKRTGPRQYVGGSKSTVIRQYSGGGTSTKPRQVSGGSTSSAQRQYAGNSSTRTVTRWVTVTVRPRSGLKRSGLKRSASQKSSVR